MAEQDRMTPAEARRNYNAAVYGTNNPNAEVKKRREGELRRETIVREALESGKTPEEAEAAAAGSGINSFTPRLDRAAFDGSQRQLRLGAAPQETRDRNLPVKQLIRKFKGLAPLAETPEQFSEQLERSKGFGAQSGLLTPVGRARASESAIAAGLSPSEAQSQIKQSVASLLKDKSQQAKRDKGIAQSTPPPVSASGPPPAADPVAPTKTPVADTPPTDKGATKPLVIPEYPLAEEAQETQGLLPDGPIVGTANVIGKAASTVVGGVGSNLANATQALTQASLPRLGSGTTTAAQDAAAVLNKARDVAKAKLNLTNAGLVSKMVGPASRVGKVLGVFGRATNAANKIKEAYETVRFFGDKDYQDATIKEMSDFGERGLKAFGPEGTAGDKLSYVGGALGKGPDTMKTLLSLGALQTQNRRSQNDAASAKRAADRAQVLFDARIKARRANISDEDFRALPPKERSTLMNRIREAIK